MKKFYLKRLILIMLVSCGLFTLLTGSKQLKPQPFKLMGVSDLCQVFEDGYNMPATTDEIRIFGIRGEVLSGQCVVNARSNLNVVSIEISPIKNNISGEVIPSQNVEWNFVGSIPLTKNASNQPKQALVREAPALYPDYLMSEKQIDISKGTYKSIWLTISIPENMKSGEYSGNITVKASQGEQSLPIFLTIYPLTLSSERNLKVTEWFTTSKFQKFHGIEEQYSDEWFGMLRKYAENMVAHRQNIFQVPISSITITQTKNGVFGFDFTRFDQIADIFWSTGKMDYLETGHIARFGEGSFSSTEIILNNFNVKNEETGEIKSLPGSEVIPYFIQAFENHLRKKGWLDKTLFHIRDEPAHHNAHEWINISKLIHQYGPDLKRIDALCTSFVINDLEIAVPKLDALDAGYGVFKKWQDRKNELWFYTVGIFMGSIYPNKTIDRPLIGNRILHWLNYKYDAKGFLHWGWNQWVDDPYKETGDHTGDGYHVYPVKDGVLNSLRWEQMRNGIQDYECFYMLGEKVQILKDSLGSRFSWIEPAQRGKEIVSQVATNLVRHSTDPEVLYRAKKDLINELLDFGNSPMVYIQTNPMEHENIINRSIVELCGWVEPGSVVSVNSQKLPVAYDGLIMGRFIIYTGGKLEITVTKDNKTKKLIREFDVTF